MSRDPFARVPVTARLWAAAGLSALPLGLAWARTSYGYESPARIFLVGAAIALIVTAWRVRADATHRLARLAIGMLAVAAALAAADRNPVALTCTVIALALIRSVAVSVCSAGRKQAPEGPILAGTRRPG